MMLIRRDRLRLENDLVGFSEGKKELLGDLILEERKKERKKRGERKKERTS